MTRTRARANGEGSIFPYRNGYAAYAWVTTPTGRRQRKYIYGRTREIVHENWISLQQKAAERRSPLGRQALLSTWRIGSNRS